jgi:formate-dependent phosphoribosylglycinamide formyltransferase (GAR transformylase)
MIAQLLSRRWPEIPGLAHQARPGLRTTMLVRLSALPRVRDPGMHARLVALPHDGGAGEWVEMARCIHARDPFGHLATYGERDQDKAAAIGAALGLRTHSPQTARWVHDKAAMRQRLAALGVDGTPSGRVRNIEEAAQAGRQYGYPFVLKPVAGTGSAGVTVVHSPADLAAAWEWAARVTAEEPGELVAERYLDGTELSVETLSEDGEHRIVCLTGKVKTATHCVELGHMVPGPFDAATREAVSRFTASVLDALGVRDGVGHTEIIVTADGPHVVETHLRPAGDEIPEMIRDTHGIDLLDLLVRQSLGEHVMGRLDGELKAAAKITTCAAIWFGTPAASGRIVAVTGIEAAREMAGVVGVDFLKEAGDELPAELTHSGTAGGSARAISARATADDPREALRRAKAAAEAVRFTVEAMPAYGGPPDVQSALDRSSYES